MSRALQEPPPASDRHALLIDLARAEHGLGRPEALDHVREAFRTAGDEVERAEAALALMWATGPGQQDPQEAYAMLEQALAGVAGRHRELELQLEAVRLTAAFLSAEVLAQRWARPSGSQTSKDARRPSACCCRTWPSIASSSDSPPPMSRSRWNARWPTRRSSQASARTPPGWTSCSRRCSRPTGSTSHAARSTSRSPTPGAGDRRRGLSQPPPGERGSPFAKVRRRCGGRRAGRLRGPGATLLGSLLRGLPDRGARGPRPARRGPGRSCRRGWRGRHRRRSCVRRTALRALDPAHRARRCPGSARRPARGAATHRRGPAGRPGLRRPAAHLPPPARHGDVSRAAKEADAALAWARTWDPPGYIGQALTVRGSSTTTCRSFGRRSSTSSDSPPVESSPAWPGRAAGRAPPPRRSDQRPASPLRRARIDIAASGGLIAIEERAREELRVAGARLRRAEATGLAALTPSERRIVELAAGGATNAEIAQGLFVDRQDGRDAPRERLPQARDQLATRQLEPLVRARTLRGRVPGLLP